MGDYKITCNKNTYGDIYSEKLENIMGVEYLYDFFSNMLKIGIELDKKNYIALSNIESYKIWIEFEKVEEFIFISIVNADKGSEVYIAYELKNKKLNKNYWENEKIKYKDFKNELILKVTMYMEEVKKLNKKTLQEIEYLNYLKIKLENI